MVKEDISCDLSIRAPEEAIRQLKIHKGAIIVDFDETLYLRNSTEDFISFACASLIMRIMLKLLDVARPWLFTGGRGSRDVWRVGLVMLLIPSALGKWRSQAASLASKHVNVSLKKVLAQGHDGIVVTAGFKPLVEPLLAAMGLGHLRLVACRLGSCDDRVRGKLALAQAALEVDTIRGAAVITDSLDDADLLRACSCPLLVRWPDARFVPFDPGIYIPFEYIVRVKRPGLNFFVRSVLADDFALWIVASIAIAHSPVQHTLGLFILLLSFWIIYEAGYVDNDYIAANYEAAPVLTGAFYEKGVATSLVQPWLWALFLGGIGVAALHYPAYPTWTGLGAWTAVLVSTYAVYLIYNRIDKTSRVWLYGPLQVARAAAFLVVAPATMIGALALGAHSIQRWITYFVYRLSGGSWPDLPASVVRLIIFLMLVGPVVFVVPLDHAERWTAIAILLWLGFRASPKLISIWGSVRLVANGRSAASQITRGTAHPRHPSTSP